MEWDARAWRGKSAVAAVLLAVLAAPEASGADDPEGLARCSPARFTVVTGVVADPQQQVARLREALVQRGIEPADIDLIVVDESKRERLRGQIDRARLEGRSAIVTLSGRVAQALTRMGLSTPTVFVTMGNPVEWGIVDGMGRHRANATGITFNRDLDWKFLEYLQMAYPGRRRVGVLADADYFKRPFMRGVIKAAPARMNTVIVPFVASTAEDLRRIEHLPEFRSVDGWIVPETTPVLRHEDKVLELLARRGVPAIFGHASLLEKGALLVFGADLGDFWHEVGRTISMICAGADAREIPVVRAHEFFLGVSLTNAARRGLPMNSRILRLATQVH